MSNNGYFLKAIVVNSTRLCSSSIGLGYMIHVFQLAVVGMANRFVLLLDLRNSHAYHPKFPTFM